MGEGQQPGAFPTISAAWSMRSDSESSIGMCRSVAPVRKASSCQGIRLAWCSISVTTISSPGPECQFPQPRVAASLRSPQAGVGQRVADEVQALSGVGRPDDFLELRPDEVGNSLPGVLEHLRGLNGKVVGAAVHGGVPLLVELLFGLDDAQGIL